ncbi:GatB/YqeY domain-containing protein [Candidatus Uhrbacteria bacterium]|nr:GatB/YqeY domain-containing protein [Candidatus Uhrbacteria bacterium]
MSIKSDLKQELVTAMKAKDEFSTSILRMLNSSIKNKEIDLGHELSDDEVMSDIKTMVKQGKDALADFQAAGRDDLAEKQQKELAFLERFLPEQMSDERIEELVREAIAQTGASGPSDMGKVMGAVMKQAGGAADGNRVREIVQKILP